MKKALLSLFLAFFATVTMAQSWPTKPITIIVPFPAGGLGDVHSRAVAADLEKTYNVSVIVRNLPGSGHAVAIAHVLGEDNDNHTFMWVNDEFVLGPYISGTRNYEKFTMTNYISKYPAVIFGGPNSSIEKFKQQISERKSVNAGVLGVNGKWWLYLTNLESPNLKINPISYKGQAQMLPDIMNGTLDYGVSNLSLWYPLVQEGKLKPLMISTATRQSYLKDTPTYKELGFGGEPVTGFMGFATRKNTSAEAIEKFAVVARKNAETHPIVSSFAQKGMNMVNMNVKDSEAAFGQEIKLLDKIKFTKE